MTVNSSESGFDLPAPRCRAVSHVAVQQHERGSGSLPVRTRSAVRRPRRRPWQTSRRRVERGGCPPGKVGGQPADRAQDRDDGRPTRLCRPAPVPVERVDVDHRPLRAFPTRERLGRGCIVPRSTIWRATSVGFMPRVRRGHTAASRYVQYARSVSIPAASVTGPCPGTTTAGPEPRSGPAPRASSSGPAHITGHADEQDVGGEHDARVGHVDDQVARRVRGADLDQPHLAAADVERELAAELARRRGDRARAEKSYGASIRRCRRQRARRARAGSGRLPTAAAGAAAERLGQRDRGRAAPRG